MALISLNTLEVENSFFENTGLFAIAAGGCAAYRFAWFLNRALGLDLRRNPVLDVLSVERKKKRETVAISLFEQEEESQAVIRYFPVFQHKIPLSGSSIFLYKNRLENKYLIPEFKQADYFLLLPYDTPFQVKELIIVFDRLPVIQWVREVEANTLKSKKNFMF